LITWERELADKEQALELHRDLDFIGLRAQATTVGLLQLCAELVKVGVLDGEAIGRIKEAITWDITVSNPRVHDRAEFETTLRKRLDAIFPRAEDAHRASRVGNVQDMQSALIPVEEPREND
jgi:hypothetical protein